MKTMMQGIAPLTARLEPWMESVMADTQLCAELLERHGSPLNLHNFSAMDRNVAELRAAAANHDITFQIYLARKANKTLGAVEQAAASDCGIDVASLNELRQVLDAGVPGEKIVLTAAVKSTELLRLAVTNNVVISLDNYDEAAELLGLEPIAGKPLRVALRLASDDPGIPPTRFGLKAGHWLNDLKTLDAHQRLKIEGIHFHLNGYDHTQRAILIVEALSFIERLRMLGHRPSFIDMGGGIPMSYLESAAQWDQFWSDLSALPAGNEELTWKSDRLGAHGPVPSAAVYPYHQSLVRGPWLDRLLRSRPDGQPLSIADRLRSQNIELRCEPGRSLLDGCGITLASVAFSKSRSDGVPLVGLHMNRTQCRSTSADFLLDPILLQAAEPVRERSPLSGFLVGAYCIEEELLLRRRFDFPHGVAPRDIVVFPNTAGYLMHIVESASHQLPLAANLRWDGQGWVPDAIDELV